MHTPWNRLIRFVAKEDSNIHFGQPVDANQDVGLASHDTEVIKAYEILGDIFTDSVKLTDNVLTVDKLLSPLSREQVGLVRCLGLNYADHAAEANLPKPAFPVLFYKPAASLIGPNDPIIIPSIAQPVQEHLSDWEAEMVVVIGKLAKNVPEQDALDYVLGYTAANDISFRKHQMAVPTPDFSKSFDDTNPFGPCLVSPSLIPNPQSLGIKCTINTSTYQNGNTSDHIFSVRQTIAHLSSGTSLYPGTIILTGTPKGVGFTMKPNAMYLKDGHEVRTWVGGGVGTLVNKVVEEKA